jgi:hypothetical protein
MTKTKKSEAKPKRSINEAILADALLCMVNVLARHHPVIDTPEWRLADKIARRALLKVGVGK